jgi:hypothetical protein
MKRRRLLQAKLTTGWQEAGCMYVPAGRHALCMLWFTCSWLLNAARAAFLRLNKAQAAVTVTQLAT